MKFSLQNILFIIIILIILYFVFKYLKIKITLEGFTSKIKNPNKCKKGCPLAKNENDIYKLHVDYKPVRDNNHMLAHHEPVFSFFNSNKGPKNIFIIRHAEKQKKKEGLDCNGIYRSSYIPTFIENLNKQGYGINALITANDYNSMHQEQTIMLSSWLFSIPLYIYGECTDVDAAITEMFTNPYFNDKTILMSWEHTCIQSLVSAIINLGPKYKGISNYQFKNPEGNNGLPYWDTNNFQSCFHFDEQLNFSVSTENITTCYDLDNDKIIYGKSQVCKG